MFGTQNLVHYSEVIPIIFSFYCCVRPVSETCSTVVCMDGNKLGKSPFQGHIYLWLYCMRLGEWYPGIFPPSSCVLTYSVSTLLQRLTIYINQYCIYSTEHYQFKAFTYN